MLRSLMLSIAGNETVERVVTESSATQRLARRFVAGDTLSDAIAETRRMNERGLVVTLDALGENVTTAEEAEAAAREYCAALQQIAEAGVESTISIKLTMLGLDLSDDVCRRHLHQILDCAETYDNFVRIDMEGSSYTQRTLDLFYEAHQRYGDHVGIVLQSYLYRTDQDLREAIDRGVKVRLVKGAYAEPETVAYPSKREIDDAFRRHTEWLLMEGNDPAIATHDDGLIAMTKVFADFHGIDRSRFEFQMLYGVRTEFHEQLVRDGYRMRVYAPYGGQWYPYFSRRIAERPANAVFVLRQLVRP